jgi:AraC-like DNA-binding protein
MENCGALLDYESLGMIEDIRGICRETLSLVEDLLEYARVSESRPSEGDVRRSGPVSQLQETSGWGEIPDDVRANANESDILDLVGVDNARIPESYAIAVRENSHSLPTRNGVGTYENRRLYTNIVTAIHKKYPWLELYAPDQRNEARDKGEFDCEEDLRYLRELVNILENLVPTGVHGMLEGVCDFILNNPESEINLRVLAERFFVNRTYLSLVFHQKTGLHFREYLMRARMFRARRLLESSGMKINEISGCLGYSDSDYFRRLYKKFIGEDA